MVFTEHLWLVLLGPAIGALANGLWPARARGRAAHGVLACAAVGFAFLVALCQHVALSASGEEFIRHVYYRWMPIGPGAIDLALRLDPLSSVMCLTVTGVALLIHLYSLGYMAKDPDYVRFFTCMNLFTTAMLLLVMGSNLAVLFVGWEGVGLCSYLLIGFWHKRDSASRAGFKAFVVNRIGDFGFLLGMFWCYKAFGSLEIQEIVERVGQASPADVRWITLLLFVGAAGKSAQIPLYVWLPDAMEGPTPVSALIHAATMVTAGVYMVVRLSALYALESSSAWVVAWIGAATAIFSATIALAQNDIKRVLAYSTVSQLGFMFLAAGVGAYTAAIFHLVTHAFFKACLFLCAGSVIHACHEEQDITRMGGLKAKLPTTYWTFAASSLAIAGIIPFSGFFSKDEILISTFQHSLALYAVGLAAALLTAFYMFRLLYLTFHGETRLAPEAFEKVHEAPPSMARALVVLASLAAVGGLLGLPLPGRWHVLRAYLAPILPHPEDAAHGSCATEITLAGVALVIAFAGIRLATAAFLGRADAQEAYERRLGAWYPVLRAKYRVDEIYLFCFVTPLSRAARWIGEWFDPKVIDGAVLGAARLVGEAGRVPAAAQSGRVRDYAVVVLVGMFLVVWLVLASRYGT